MSEELKNLIGKRLKEVRTVAYFNVREFSNGLKITTNTLRNYERGKKLVPLDVLWRIRDVRREVFDYILCATDNLLESRDEINTFHREFLIASGEEKCDSGRSNEEEAEREAFERARNPRIDDGNKLPNGEDYFVEDSDDEEEDKDWAKKLFD